jgi:hypothetical protein
MVDCIKFSNRTQVQFLYDQQHLESKGNWEILFIEFHQIICIVIEDKRDPSLLGVDINLTNLIAPLLEVLVIDDEFKFLIVVFSPSQTIDLPQ